MEAELKQHSLEHAPGQDDNVPFRPAARETNNARPTCFKSTLAEILFIITATMAVAMSALLTGSVTVTSSYIGRSLNMTTAEITWITSANSLSAGAFLLLFGKIADLFGRKILFVGSLFFFAVFALVTGFLTQPIQVDILSGVLGLTSASAVPPAVGLLGACYENGKRKNRAFACFSSGNALGFAVGAIGGGVAATIFDWRASFWLMAMIFLATAIVAMFAVPKDDSTTTTRIDSETVKSLDLLGVILIVFGIGMFSAALSLGDSAGWSASYVVVLLVLGIVLLAAFILWELWYSHPLVPMHIFKDANFSISLAILALGFMAFIPGSFFLALYFQDVWNLSPIETAVHLLPMLFVGLATNFIAGMLLHRVSNKLLMAIATASYPIGFFLLAMNRQNSSYWAFAFTGQIFIIIAVDFQFNVVNILVITSLPRSQQSIAGGLLQTAVRLTTTLGFGIGTAIFNVVQRNGGLASYWDDATQPYACVFWASMVYSSLSLCLVPLLSIGTQGDSKASVDAATETEFSVPSSRQQEAGEELTLRSKDSQRHLREHEMV